MVVSWFSRFLDALFSLAFGPSPNPLPPPPPPIMPPTPTPASSDAILAAVNAQRAIHGCSPLEADATLEGMALSWARQMAATGVLAHGNVPDPGGQCVAMGYPTAEACVYGWINEPFPALHRKILLTPSYTRGGGAMATDGSGRTWWVFNVA